MANKNMKIGGKMANKNKNVSLQAHLEKTRVALKEVEKGNVPQKHKDSVTGYLQFLNKEIFLTEAAINKLTLV
jgi:hypothetical protein